MQPARPRPPPWGPSPLGPALPRARQIGGQRRLPAPASLQLGHSYALGGALGRIYLEELLGRGASAAVFGVRSQQLPGAWALKVVRLGHSQRQRVCSALALQRRCAGPHVLAALGAHIGPHRAYLLMERAAGGNFEAWLCGPGRDAPLPLRLAHATGLADAVAACHARGVTHRDIKPENFLFVDPAQQVLKLGDFEFACERPSAQSVGTVTYMAPEALMGAHVGPAADVWALGVSLFRVVVGIEPHYDDDEAETAQRILGQCPSTTLDDLALCLAMHRFAQGPALVALVQGALAANPAERPTAAEFGRRLAALTSSRERPTP